MEVTLPRLEGVNGTEVIPLIGLFGFAGGNGVHHLRQLRWHNLLMTRLRNLPTELETDPKKALELVVGLPKVSVLGVNTLGSHVEFHVEKPTESVGCPTCGVVAQLKGWRDVVLIDLPVFSKPTRLHWHKRRWRCADPDCTMGSWTEQDPRIAPARMAMTDRAGRWVTAQVGRCARSIAEVARDLGCDWHTVNDAVVRYGGGSLVDDCQRPRNSP